MSNETNNVFDIDVKRLSSTDDEEDITQYESSEKTAAEVRRFFFALGIVVLLGFVVGIFATAHVVSSNVKASLIGD